MMEHLRTDKVIDDASRGLARAQAREAMWLGILSLVLVVLPVCFVWALPEGPVAGITWIVLILIGLAAGILAIVMSAKARRVEGQGGTAGLVMGIIGTTLNALWLLLVLAALIAVVTD
jgi:hypothetical protein